MTLVIPAHGVEKMDRATMTSFTGLCSLKLIISSMAVLALLKQDAKLWISLYNRRTLCLYREFSLTRYASPQANPALSSRWSLKVAIMYKINTVLNFICFKKYTTPVLFRPGNWFTNPQNQKNLYLSTDWK